MSKAPTPEAQRRRLESDLVVIGTGVIAFGAWTVAKTVLLCVLHGADMQYALLSMGAEVSLSMIFAAFGIAVGIDFAMRLFVGLSARSEGMGKRTRRVYLAVAVLIALICTASVASTAFGVVMEGVDAIAAAFRRTDIIFIQ